MKLHILKIILWPKDSSLPPRIITFEEDKVNVITGESRSGKSSIVAIIDYCLGSGKCAIPVGIIREKTEWFGLHLKLRNSELIVARREPGQQIQSGDTFILEGIDLNATEVRPTKNSTSTALVAKLGGLAGLGQSTLGDTNVSGFQGQVSFRDLAAFNFLPQHIVANPYTLFYKADTYEHQQKLREIFPVALGAITPQSLALKRRLKDLSDEHRRLIDQMAQRDAASRVWSAEIKGYYSRAKEYGLLSSGPTPQPNWTQDDYLLYLREVPKLALEKLPKPDQKAVEQGLTELMGLHREEEACAIDLSTLRLKLSKLESIADSSTGFGKEVYIQSKRLAAVGWFEKKVKEVSVCPFCEQDSGTAFNRIQELARIASAVDQKATGVAGVSDILDKELQSLRKQVLIAESKLSAVREQRQALEQESNANQQSRYTIQEIYRFIGRLEQGIANIDETANDSDFRSRLIEVENEIHSIQGNPALSGEKARLAAALEHISRFINDYLRILESDKADALVRLDINNLSLRIQSEGRDDFLFEIGSGANWMAFHIAAFLALHQYLLSLSESVVPCFVVIDQPSQVYFPESWPEDKGAEASPKRLSADSADIQGVHRVFEAVSKSVNLLKGKLQVIIVDHADEITWQGIDNINLVERWRIPNDFLVPQNWY